MLGRTLDELPPQTRRLLRLTQQWVNAETHRHTPTAEGQPYPQRCLDVMAGLLTLTEAYDLTQTEVKSAFLGTFKGSWGQGTPQPFWRPGEIGSPVKQAFLCFPCKHFFRSNGG